MPFLTRTITIIIIIMAARLNRSIIYGDVERAAHIIIIVLYSLLSSLPALFTHLEIHQLSKPN